MHWPEGSSWCPEYLLIFAPSLRQFQPDLVPTSNLKRPTWQVWQLASNSELCTLRKSFRTCSVEITHLMPTFVLFQIYVYPDWDGHCTRGQFPAKTWTIPNYLPGFERHQHLHFFHSQNTKVETRANICVHVSYITYTYANNPIFKFKQKDFFQTWEEIVPKWFWQESFMIKHEMNGTINRFKFWFFFVDLSWRWGSSLVQIVWKLGWEPFKGESSSENPLVSMKIVSTSISKSELSSSNVSRRGDRSLYSLWF